MGGGGWREGPRLAAWTAGVLLVGLLAGLCAHDGIRAPRIEASANSIGPVPEESPFVRVAERVLPAVVSVEANRLFQHPMVARDTTDGTGPMGQPMEEIEVPSSGSGFLIDQDGHILTNNHVVAGAVSIRVHLADGRMLTAHLVGTDPLTDVAVLRIEAQGLLPTVELGDSDDLRIGEWVAAVGNPMGVLEGSLTVGVVSAKKRNEIQISGSSPSYQDFIQTDAAINFGNSGGPLVNTRGQVVGINTAFGGPGRGLGFAVSINMAKEVAHGLIDQGRVVRGYLGVILQPLDPLLAQGLGLPDERGVMVREVQPGTPADAAELLAGDVILSFDGIQVTDLPGFQLQVARTRLGRSVPLRIYRQGAERNLRVELVERPDFEQTSERTEPVRPAPTELGLDLMIYPEGAAFADDTPAQGVLVEKVADGSLAAQAGLQQGDGILEVDGRAVASPESCFAAIEKAHRAGRPAVLRLQRESERWFLALPLPGSTEP